MKLYLPTSAEPVSWRQWKTRVNTSPGWASVPITGKLAVYKAIAEAQTGISRTDIITATGLKPHTVSFYLSKFKGQGFIFVKGEAPGASSQHSATSINMSFDDAKVAALLALENALVIKAKERGITDDMRTAFVVYQKVKAKVLTPPDPTASAAERDGAVVEANSALKLSLRKLLDMLF